MTFVFWYLLALCVVFVVSVSQTLRNWWLWDHNPSPWTRRMIGGAWYCRGGRWTRTPPQDVLDPVEEVEAWPEPYGERVLFRATVEDAQSDWYSRYIHRLEEDEKP